MLTRRSLFARLSAVALAPLVKLVPKRHAWPEGTYVAGTGITWGDSLVTVGGPGVEVVCEGDIMVIRAVRQEEA